MYITHTYTYIPCMYDGAERGGGRLPRDAVLVLAARLRVVWLKDLFK